MSPKTFVLKTMSASDSIVNYIENLPYDGSMEVVIRKHTKKRSLDQNALYWRLISQIAEQAWVEGKQFSQDVWHQYCKSKIMSHTVKLKNGETSSKIKELPLLHKYGLGIREGMIISTTELSKESFSEYIEAVTAFAVTELGVKFEADQRTA